MQVYRRLKNLQGDPHYVALGMAVGVFIGLTPTFPFHILLAVALAFLLRGSKAAAAVGVWVGNPLTMPFSYYLSYRIGNLMLNQPCPLDLKYKSIFELSSLGWTNVAAMLIGGAVIGLPPAIVAYFITRSAFRKIHRRRLVRLGPTDSID